MSRTRVPAWIYRLARVLNVAAWWRFLTSPPEGEVAAQARLRRRRSGPERVGGEALGHSIAFPPHPARKASPISPSGGEVRRTARRALFTFPLVALVLHLATVGAMEAWPRLRDPEYGRRAERLRERVAQYPDRPLVLVFGSSRVSMGVRPSAWEETRPGSLADPLLFNMSEFGAGPIVQLILVRRVFADGFCPDAVVLEYWPPMLRQHDGHGDTTRFDQHRLRWDDRPVVRDYYPDPEAVERRMRNFRLNPLTENGSRLLVQLDSRWVPGSVQSDKGWAEMDGWGWAPGMDVRPDDAPTRHKLTDHIRVPFAAQLAGCTIHPDSDRALRASVAVARAHGARVAFVFMPESGEFQSRYPADLEHSAREHLARLSAELAVPVIPARDWMDERYLADGFHLSRAGAAVFTAKLGPAIAETFVVGHAARVPARGPRAPRLEVRRDR